MKKISIVVLFFSTLVYGSGVHHDEEVEFSLRPNVIKNFEINSIKILSSSREILITDSAIVRSLDKTTIFERKETTFRRVPVKILKTENGRVLIRPLAKLEFDEIVNSGTNYLQTIFLSLEEGPSEGHGH